MNVPRTLEKIEKLDKEQNKILTELSQLIIEVKSAKAYAKTTELVLKEVKKELEKLSKNLNKAGDECACKPNGYDSQCEKVNK